MKVDTAPSPVTFEELVEMADDAGVKLEMTGGIPTWEAFPGPRHQKAVLRALMSIAGSADRDCGCFQLPDVYIKFPDGSLKRPDIAVFSEEPPDTDVALQSEITQSRTRCAFTPHSMLKAQLFSLSAASIA